MGFKQKEYILEDGFMMINEFNTHSSQVTVPKHQLQEVGDSD